MVGATALSLEGLVAVDADVVRLRRGDLNALSELITRYQNRLYRYLLRIVRQPAEAEDLFQQTWLRVVEKIRSFDASRNEEAQKTLALYGYSEAAATLHSAFATSGYNGAL